MIHTVENCNARSARALYRVAGAHTGAERVVRGQRMLEGLELTPCERLEGQTQSQTSKSGRVRSLVHLCGVSLMSRHRCTP